MGYHAYRNIGFVFTDTEANCVKWRAKFTDYNPQRAERIMGFVLHDGYLYLNYFGRSYRLRIADGVLEKASGSKEASELKTASGSMKDVGPEEASGSMKETWTEELFMNEALVIYHILGDLKENPHLSGEWVPEAELDPVRIRSGNRTDPMLIGFARDFSGKTRQLAEACERIGGRKLEQGDCAYEFFPFPQIAVRLIFWEADEDFPAQVQALVDRTITDYLHFEAVGCMIADLFELIGQSAQLVFL